VLLLLVVASVVSTAFAYSASVPLFAWAGQKHFRSGSSSHVTVNDVVNENDFASLLSRITTNYGSSRLVNDDDSISTPELVLAFVNAQLSSNIGSQSSGAYSTQVRPSALKAALLGSSSSLAVPFMSLNLARTSLLIK